MEGGSSLPPNPSPPRRLTRLAASSFLSAFYMAVRGSCLPSGLESHTVRIGLPFYIALFEQGIPNGPVELFQLSGVK